MSRVDVTALRPLLAAATPGEWRATKPSGAFDAYKPPYIKSNDRRVAIVDGASPVHGNDIADAALICAAVNALPELLAVFEAAFKLRDNTWINSAGIHAKESSMREFCSAVDAARGAEARPARDSCAFCRGTRGGEPGNENIVHGIICCDDCSVIARRLVDAARKAGT